MVVAPLAQSCLRPHSGRSFHLVGPHPFSHNGPFLPASPDNLHSPPRSLLRVCWPQEGRGPAAFSSGSSAPSSPPPHCELSQKGPDPRGEGL